MSQVFPLLYALMTKKTTGAYKAIFRKAKELGISARNFISDWEKAERNAFKEASGNDDLNTWGCVWHYMRVRSIASFFDLLWCFRGDASL